MSESPVIQARSVTRRFGSLVAVNKVDLEVRPGEIFGFLGPNGAGKSTLIRIIIGLLQPSSGSLKTLGFTIPRESESLRSRVGYMTQKFSLFEDLSVEENLDFAAEIFGIGSRERHDRVERALTEYGLLARRDQRPATLSGGWKQRLALATATIHDPELLVLDEPTAGVDPENRRAFWHKLFALGNAGTTILVSTHYMDEAARCHRLCLMKEGAIVGEGSPAELKEPLADRVLRISTNIPERAAVVLEGENQVESVAQMGDTLHILLQPDSVSYNVEEVLSRLLVDHGFEDVEVESAPPSLEDVFVAITRDSDQSFHEVTEA